MRSAICRIAGAAVVLAFAALCVTASGAAAETLTTKYYTLDVPQDWKILAGPTEKKGVTHLHLAQKNHKCSVLVNIDKAKPGDAEKCARYSAKVLNGSKPVMRNGQWEFTFKKMGDSGYCIVREDKKAGLLISLVVSGSNLPQANFVYSMRGGYPALVPHKPEKLW
ncbi:MAG: hypothetical protein LBR31_00305 [Desulfovibrio sp.]|jgi:hypothetical protein|nr:hypothetical protein [Desulfovibrio sp.]